MSGLLCVVLTRLSDLGELPALMDVYPCQCACFVVRRLRCARFPVLMHLAPLCPQRRLSPPLLARAFECLFLPRQRSDELDISEVQAFQALGAAVQGLRSVALVRGGLA